MTGHGYFTFCRELLSYTDGNVPLAETDFDKIAKVKSKSLFKEEEQVNEKEDRNPSDCTGLPASFQNDIHLSTGCNETEGEREVGLPQVESLCNSNSQGAQLALKLSFTLPASSYATMAIRELLKTSTSVSIFIYILITKCVETIINLEFCLKCFST